MNPAETETSIPEVRTLAERVFQQLQDAIVRGELAPGSKITEPGLSRTYGISRGPLREAMRRLEAHRLIERVPHVGARVVQLSMQELLELFDVREARSEEHTSELQSRPHLVCRLLLEKKKEYCHRI